MKLTDVNLMERVDDEYYTKRLSELQYEILRYQIQLFQEKVPVILLFEGWDAAGKGGVIKRITEKLDPRMFNVHPIGPPTPTEQKNHYMRRFWLRLPTYGQLGIFDRSWYGRVLVERIEGYCTTKEWERAYEEINEFEKQLIQNGYMIQKYFLHITKDKQLERFQDRETHSYKQWKLSGDDWRNRGKWNDYEKAIQDMLNKTNTSNAPWKVVSFEQKKSGRLQVMEHMLKAYKAFFANK
ncbi:UDP-galactose-lipid carrier transferase [Desulfuribacillus stibiiarsenatis]|uniref:UDP-galactose-lipid carrier transferase n=1 Tax=Desulfuribacillus stibiiarsenatis TaxID=1390249 RepID=A0A1E5L9G1_9FIRM|nr:UDP-galactose-lipid carrier transferase [Desulfuribacillus stibiiarsenatis]OEH86664.1 UDP-galactose-lipid carrier transferase [Desulfuribacillus stibiiarsenatis]